ncbi:MAG: hypothetical protein HZA16_06580 [Nitrospirae bacterium]|nr:hypothetical protein [Nitrospirota bacterium]
MKETVMDDDEIKLSDYIHVLRKRMVSILLIITVSVAATGIVSFMTPPVFESKALIMPASPQREQGGMSAIASTFGISTAGTSNVSEMLALLKSNILIERVINKYDLVPVFSSKGSEKLTASGKTWLVIKSLKELFKVKHNQKEGIIELSAEFRDPAIATDLLNYMLIELTDYMSSEARRVAETNRKYLESLIDRNADPLIRQKIYSLIALQIETAMMAEVKENFAFKILDPPRASPDRIRPTRKKNVLIAFVVSVFAGVFFAFAREYSENAKKSKRTAKGENE